VQLRLPWLRATRQAPRRVVQPLAVDVAGRTFPVLIVRHRRARRYLLRVTPEGALRLTVPRAGSIAAGVRFAQSQIPWITAEWARLTSVVAWGHGTAIWYRGIRVPLSLAEGTAAWADRQMPLKGTADVRCAVQSHLRTLAATELPQRCLELAEHTGLRPSRIAVRNQRSRWGSCSARGAVQLNWRLIQMPPDVSDYVMLHELVHLVQPNHSRRFWRAVEGVCPEWRAAEQWLRKHGRELL
jgi:predicted metal-dependent hydrolase